MREATFERTTFAQSEPERDIVCVRKRERERETRDERERKRERKMALLATYPDLS